MIRYDQIWAIAQPLIALHMHLRRGRHLAAWGRDHIIPCLVRWHHGEPAQPGCSAYRERPPATNADGPDQTPAHRQHADDVAACGTGRYPARTHAPNAFIELPAKMFMFGSGHTLSRKNPNPCPTPPLPIGPTERAGLAREGDTAVDATRQAAVDVHCIIAPYQRTISATMLTGHIGYQCGAGHAAP